MDAMTNQSKKQPRSSLADNVIDDLLALSDSEILSEAIEDFGSVDAAIRDMRSEIETAIIGVAKEKLADARSALMKSRQNPRIRIDAGDVKKLKENFLSSEGGTRLTLAARKGKKSSERDLLGAFADLCELQSNSQTSPRLNFGNAPKAEYILKELGITDPREIDVEAIAWHLGARVRYDSLQDCEARIVGTDDAAIITVDEKSSSQRQRFSVCHELGHWIHHRRRVLMCHGDDIERPSTEASSMERMADRFASELLMPSYLFVSIAEEFGKPSMSVVRKLSEAFDTSLTAAAIRFVETSSLPILLTCHNPNGRKWFARSQCVVGGWLPRSDLSPESSAFSMVFGKVRGAMAPKTVSAATWFSRHDASRWEVVEESARVTSQEVITLLSFKNPKAFMSEVN
jgi:Zn-dependent peptidase ImmA (M78 family)